MTAFQSAYRKHHSTESALLNIYNDILLNMAKGSVTVLTLLDLSAVFDTIDHTILMDRHNVYYGISELTLGWFKSYLSGRTHWVKVGNTLSHPAVLQYGIPQGSVLGPILFSLYTNPISSIIHSHSNINHHFYADDTQLYITLTPTNLSRSIQKLKNCLSDIQNFMSANKLKLNPKKTEFFLIGSKKLHWLPIKYRIQFKIHLITYKILNQGQPVYLRELIHPYTSSRNTRRSTPKLKFLHTPTFDCKVHKSVKLFPIFSVTMPQFFGTPSPSK